MKRFSMLTALVLLIMLCLGGSAAQGEALLDGGMTYPTGYPITKEVIELDVLVMQHIVRPNMNANNILKQIEEETNIRLNVTYVTDAEQVNLMYASRTYPDFAMSIGTNALQLANGVEAGDVVRITELIDQYAPTWKSFFEKYPLARKTLEHSDGELYGLTFCNFAPYDRDIRDMWGINKVWLEELGLKKPTTTKEFKEVLMAFRDNAGTGTIPKNVIPYYFLFDKYINGQMDIYNSFGIEVTTSDYLAVKDGKVVYQAVNPAMKEPLKYLADLYSEGLIAPETFTDDSNLCYNKINSDPPVVGSYHAYGILSTYFAAMGPLDAENGEPSYIRRQNYTASGNSFMMYANNPYPIATIRLCEYVVDTMDHGMTVMYGTKGLVWDYMDDGRVTLIIPGANSDTSIIGQTYPQDQGYWNSFIGIRDAEFCDAYYDPNEGVEDTRIWAYENVYKDHLYDLSVNYVGATLDPDDVVMMNEYFAEIDKTRKTTFARWITGEGDIDTEWDAFVQETEECGLEKWLEYKQKAYDLLNN